MVASARAATKMTANEQHWCTISDYGRTKDTEAWRPHQEPTHSSAVPLNILQYVSSNCAGDVLGLAPRLKQSEVLNLSGSG